MKHGSLSVFASYCGKSTLALLIAFVVTSCQSRGRNLDSGAVRARLEVLNSLTNLNSFPDLRLHLENHGATSIEVPDFQNSLWGKAVNVCGEEQIELRSISLWHARLTGFLEPTMRTVRPGETRTYNLSLSEEYCSLEDIIADASSLRASKRPPSRLISTEKLKNCPLVGIYCVSDRVTVHNMSLTSNIVRVRIHNGERPRG